MQTRSKTRQQKYEEKQKRIELRKEFFLRKRKLYSIYKKLFQACKKRQHQTVYELVSKIPQPDDLRWGLKGSCLSGDRTLVDYIIQESSLGMMEYYPCYCQPNECDCRDVDPHLEVCKWDWGLDGACQGGHMELVNLMISNGATEFVGGMAGACEGNQRECLDLMISYENNRYGNGIEWYSHVLKYACLGGAVDMVEYLLSKFDINTDHGCEDVCNAWYYACEGGNLEIVNKMLEIVKSLSKCLCFENEIRDGFEYACRRKNASEKRLKILELLIKNGANYWKELSLQQTLELTKRGYTEIDNSHLTRINMVKEFFCTRKLKKLFPFFDAVNLFGIIVSYMN